MGAALLLDLDSFYTEPEEAIKHPDSYQQEKHRNDNLAVSEPIIITGIGRSALPVKG